MPLEADAISLNSHFVKSQLYSYLSSFRPEFVEAAAAVKPICADALAFTLSPLKNSKGGVLLCCRAVVYH